MEQNDVIYMQAFELNTTLKDIMVDRTSLFVIDITTTVKEALWRLPERKVTADSRLLRMAIRIRFSGMFTSMTWSSKVKLTRL